MNRTDDGTLLFPKAFQESKMSILSLFSLSFQFVLRFPRLMSNGQSLLERQNMNTRIRDQNVNNNFSVLILINN